MKKNNANNIYLIPYADATYNACISQTPPADNAIFLTAEGQYPVEYTYWRYDGYMNRVYMTEQCCNQEELLASLNWNGTACHGISSLWEFDSHTANSTRICNLFHAGYEHTEKAYERSYEGCHEGNAIGTPTVKELITILSQLPEDFRVTCCGTDGYLYRFNESKYITIDTEPYLAQ